MGFRFFIAPRSVRLETSLLPSNLMWPTLTVGPSFTLKFTDTEAGGIVLMTVWIVANWCPCSASNSFNTVSASLILVGSYWLSTDRGTFAFLNRSRTSDWETELNPLYVMSRIVGRSRTMIVRMTPFGVVSRLICTFSKYPVFQRELKSRSTVAES